MENEQNRNGRDIFDETLKAYFADRHPPPPDVREQVREKLKAAAATPVNEPSPARWLWGVVLYNILVSAALIYALRLFLGPSIFVYVFVAYASFSLLATVVVVAFSLGLQARETMAFPHMRR